MKDIKSVFGAELRRARMEAGMTQEDLAFDGEVGLRFLGELENGYKLPGLMTLFKLSKALNTTPGELIGPAWDAYQ